jgi:hypothetical protein
VPAVQRRDKALWAVVPNAAQPAADRAVEFLNRAWSELAKVDAVRDLAHRAAHAGGELNMAPHAVWMTLGEAIKMVTQARAGVPPASPEVAKGLLGRLLNDPSGVGMMSGPASRRSMSELLDVALDLAIFELPASDRLIATRDRRYLRQELSDIVIKRGNIPPFRLVPCRRLECGW